MGRRAGILKGLEGHELPLVFPPLKCGASLEDLVSSPTRN